MLDDEIIIIIIIISITMICVHFALVVGASTRETATVATGLTNFYFLFLSLGASAREAATVAMGLTNYYFIIIFFHFS